MAVLAALALPINCHCDSYLAMWIMGLPTICWSHAGSPEERLGMRLKSVGKIQLLSWADAEDLRLTDVYRYMQAEELGGGGGQRATSQK